jgi:hypothetical protein
MRSTLQKSYLLPLPISGAILLMLLGYGCRGSGDSKNRRPSESRSLVPDKLFATTNPVSVWEISVHHSLVFTSREISGEEGPEQQRLRKVWVRRSSLNSRILLHPKRLVWVLPARATPGGEPDELYLILKPDSNVAAVVDHKRKVYWADSPAQVAAWVEGALKPSPTLTRLEVLAESTIPAQTPPKGPGLNPIVHRLRGLLVPHDVPGSRPGPLRYNLRSEGVEALAFGGPGQGQSLLWDFALLPLMAATSAKSLATLRGQHRWPQRVDLRLARTDPPSAPWLRTTLGLKSRKRRHVAPRLLRLPPGPGYRRMFGPLTYAKGRQLPRRTVKKPYKRRKGDPRQPALVVQNTTTRTAYLYADGVLLGWAGPRQTHTLHTGESGYYRITARSLFGTAVWGPRDLYVPGEVTLGPK